MPKLLDALSKNRKYIDMEEILPPWIVESIPKLWRKPHPLAGAGSLLRCLIAFSINHPRLVSRFGPMFIGICDTQTTRHLSMCVCVQWEFQDPKMGVLYHIRPYFAGIFPYIGLIHGRYLQFRFLKWPLMCVCMFFLFLVILYKSDLLFLDKHTKDGQFI